MKEQYAKAIEVAQKFKIADRLCASGFFITDTETDLFPKMLESWKVRKYRGWVFYTHPEQRLFIEQVTDGEALFLIGHAYNPFTLEADEQAILREAVKAKKQGYQTYLKYINSLTGVFIMGQVCDDRILVLLDCAGMMSGFYGTINNITVVTSHTVIPSIMFNLKKSEYVNKLLSYRFYKLYGNYLPGDISPYKEIRRIVPNTWVSICKKDKKATIKRFFPDRELVQVCDQEYDDHITKIANVLGSTMALIAKKWKIPAISLTGGMDSKTTLSAARHCYDSFKYFSYITSKAERIDAEAARIISASVNVEHKIYDISDDPNKCEMFDAVRRVLEFNCDFVGVPNSNDVCKRAFFANNNDFDIEVKSWVSEIARANYYKKFGKKRMPKDISPRRCSSMYKFFLHNRKLLYETDGIFLEYIQKTQLQENLNNYDWSDMFLWEIRYGSWGGLVLTSEHKYSFDITVPYNNRELLRLMLAVPLEKRRKDDLHRDLIAKMNPEVDMPGITITNLNETKFREICEKLYFNINSWLPF